MNGDPWGGSEEFWSRIAIWMAQNGYKVTCSFFEWPKGKQDKIIALQEAGCEVVLLPNPKHAKNWLNKMMARSKAKKILKHLGSRPDQMVVLNQGGFEDVTHSPFHSLHKHLGKYVLLYHNYNDNQRLSKSRIRKIATWTNEAKLNLADAEEIFHSVERISSFTIPQRSVLVNPLTIKYQAEPTPWPELDEGRYVFSVLAQFDLRRKAQDVLVKALASPKWKERNWVLYLYGGGADMQKIKVLIHEQGLDDKVQIMGHTRHVNTALQKTHLLLQITHIDAMPLSVTEAMNMARPCVVSWTGDMHLWIENEENGYIAESVTEEGIDQVLEWAWQQKDNWRQQGLEAHKTFKARYPQPYEKYYADLIMNL
jgi:glycosyltransferase involved in cell wall biosynthesis